ncbi:hypothetical protein L1887_34882 [Cichorium endivia]|nr:hypothetical protein L1887_34882 [Cichorium endivia]
MVQKFWMFIVPPDLNTALLEGSHFKLECLNMISDQDTYDLLGFGRDKGQAVNMIGFSPDGRWVVSGGLDNIWDLIAGKLLHEFNVHEGQIKSKDFHPLEFLLATVSKNLPKFKAIEGSRIPSYKVDVEVDMS